MRPFPLFFASHFRIDFYQKYIYLYICVYVCFTPVPFLTFSPRRRSPAQRSSLTYGYSNDQGTLDGSDMESLGRRCPPSESIVSTLCPPARRLRSHEAFSPTIVWINWWSTLPPLFLFLVNFHLESLTRPLNGDQSRIICDYFEHSMRTYLWSFKKQRIKRSR